MDAQGADFGPARPLWLPPGVPPGGLPPRGLYRIPAPAPQSSPLGSPEDSPARGARFCARALPGDCFSGPLPPTAHAVAGFARAHTLRAPAIEMGTRSPTPARRSGRHPRGMRTLKTRFYVHLHFHFHFHFYLYFIFYFHFSFSIFQFGPCVCHFSFPLPLLLLF